MPAPILKNVILVAAMGYRSTKVKSNQLLPAAWATVNDIVYENITVRAKVIMAFWTSIASKRAQTFLRIGGFLWERS